MDRSIRQFQRQKLQCVSIRLTSSTFKSISDVFCCLARSDIMSTSPDLTSFHVFKNISMSSLCSFQSSSSFASLKFTMLQEIDFEIKYLAGIRFVDTAKYHGSKRLWLSLSSFHMSNDSNFLNSLFRVEKGKSLVTKYNLSVIQYLIDGCFHPIRIGYSKVSA